LGLAKSNVGSSPSERHAGTETVLQGPQQA
jgi:hypothetical protein